MDIIILIIVYYNRKKCLNFFIIIILNYFILIISFKIFLSKENEYIIFSILIFHQKNHTNNIKKTKKKESL